MSDETVSDEADEHDEDDEEAEVEGHALFVEKKGFGLKQDVQLPPFYKPQNDDGGPSGYSGNTNEPVLADDV